MAENHKRLKDGYLDDESSVYPADAHDMHLYGDAGHALQQFRVPVLLDKDDSHQRLYVAAFDGTGNDADRDPEHATNVDKIRKQIETLKSDRIGVGYVAGPGTQSGAWASAMDGKNGNTYDERIEAMYKQFIGKAAIWHKEDPQAQISIADIGFSRGAEQAAGFARIVQERGIQDPAGAKYTLDKEGQITGVKYTKPPLVAPGQVAQAVALFDPVGTGEPATEKDRRLPSSVISGLQLKSEDEKRSDFKGTNIIDPGMTGNERFLGVLVPGAHSDVGGSYHRNGLSNRAGNLVIDYLNSLSDQPFLKKLDEPTDPKLNVVHRSEEHKTYGMPLYQYRDKIDRMQSGGTIDRLVPENQVGKVKDANNAEPRDETLTAQFTRQNVRIGPVPPGRKSHDQEKDQQQEIDTARPKQDKNEPKEKSFLDSIIDRLSQGAIDKDDKVMGAAVNDYMRSPLGQQFQTEVVQQRQVMEVQERQTALEAQMLAQQQETVRNPHVMRM